jgi:hypothetical protein
MEVLENKKGVEHSTPFLFVANCLFLVEPVSEQQLMSVGTPVEGADRIDITVIPIAQGEILVDVHACGKHIALSGSDAQPPPKHFTLYPCACLKFSIADIGQVDEQQVGDKGCSTPNIDPVVGVQVKVPVQAALRRQRL